MGFRVQGRAARTLPDLVPVDTLDPPQAPHDADADVNLVVLRRGLGTAHWARGEGHEGLGRRESRGLRRARQDERAGPTDGLVLRVGLRRLEARDLGQLP